MRTVQLVLLLLCFLLLLPSHAAARFPPDANWRTLETDHFFIYFTEPYEGMARRLAAMADPIHHELSDALGWVPDEKTHVTLVDHVDISNGAASVSPYNWIEINLTAPPPTSELADHDDWLRLVFLHEYVHILHMDQSFGPSKSVRDLFGRNAFSMFNGIPIPFGGFPNAFVPLWFLEGIATLGETHHTTAGRGDSAYSRMVLRMAALEHSWWPLDKGSALEAEWPGGSFRYLFGEAFLDYLIDRYGREAFVEMVHANAWGLAPLLPDLPALYKLGTSFPKAWREWEASVFEASQEQRVALSKHGLTHPVALTDERWRTHQPRLSPDGRKVYYSVALNDAYPHVRELNLDTGASRTLFERNTNLGVVAPSPDGQYLYYTQLERYQKFSTVGDVYRYDLQAGRHERLSRGERLLTVDVSPDGTHLAAVRNGVDHQMLVLYRVDGDTLVEVRELAGGNQQTLDSPRFSPDGTHITYSAWTPGGFIDIYVVTLEGDVRRLTEDRYLNITPVFSPDGHSILFSSDRTGIYNLFQLDLTPAAPTAEIPDFAPLVTPASFHPPVSTRDEGREDAAERRLQTSPNIIRSAVRSTPIRPVQVTNVMGGLFGAEMLENGEVITASYNSQGFHIAQVSLKPEGFEVEWRPDRPVAQTNYPETFTADSQPYRPGASLWPRSWTPHFYLSLSSEGGNPGNEAGVQVSGRDALGFHQYTAQALYNLHFRQPGATLRYDYSGLTPRLRFAAEDVVLARQYVDPDSQEIRTLGMRRRGVQAQAGYPFPRLRFSESISLGYVFSSASELAPPDDREALSSRIGAATLGWSYGSAQRYPVSISRQDGSLFGVNSRFASPSLGADFTELSLLGDARHYFTLAGRNVLAVQAQGGIATEDGPSGPFALGGAQPRQSIADIGVLPLRGFLDRTQQGNYLAKGSLEYRFPMGLIKRGIPFWGTAPLAADQLHGALFLEGGSAWEDQPDWLTSIGAELRFDVTVAYRSRLSFGLGVAHPLSGSDSTMLYFLSASNHF